MVMELFLETLPFYSGISLCHKNMLKMPYGVSNLKGTFRNVAISVLCTPTQTVILGIMLSYSYIPPCKCFPGKIVLVTARKKCHPRCCAASLSAPLVLL